jgi:hypothetical protein
VDSAKLELWRRYHVPAARRKDPVNLYCSLAMTFELVCVGSVGGVAAMPLGVAEPTLKYHPD